MNAIFNALDTKTTQVPQSVFGDIPQLSERQLRSQELARELMRLLQEIKQRNPRFSLRALALKLGVSHSLLVLVFKGRRSFSNNTANRIKFEITKFKEIA